jgi:TRAP transporter TAXI family solute receptor
MKKTLIHLSVALCGALCIPALGQPYSIATGPERGTYISIGEDLSKYVAAPAGLAIEAQPSKGSTENVQRLRQDRNVLLGLVQSDVYQAFLDEAAEGNAAAAEMVSPLRVVMPLYSEEIYFVVRADSDMHRIEDIRDKRISVGSRGSGTALSATTVYRMVFGSGIAERNAFFYGNTEGLRQLVDDRSIDVAVIVAGQPASIFSSMTADARKYIRLLRLEPDSPARRATAGTYSPSVIRAASYPAWLDADVPTLSMRALLVARYAPRGRERETLTRFAGALCENFERLRSHGHPKWQEVAFDLPALGTGWRYHPATSPVLDRCRLRTKPASTPSASVPHAGAIGIHTPAARVSKDAARALG